jgi:hypothetical protein
MTMPAAATSTPPRASNTRWSSDGLVKPAWALTIMSFAALCNKVGLYILITPFPLKKYPCYNFRNLIKQKAELTKGLSFGSSVMPTYSASAAFRPLLTKGLALSGILVVCVLFPFKRVSS